MAGGKSSRVISDAGATMMARSIACSSSRTLLWQPASGSAPDKGSSVNPRDPANISYRLRFRSKGGTRPDSVGMAPAYWGMTEADYKAKAHLWPLSPDGELVNWTIVESKEGLKPCARSRR